jgi:DNA replicative helicase MCM subunit Mcm2 (Cdc46/Mcm family)
VLHDFRIRIVGLPKRFESSEMNTSLTNRFVELAVAAKRVFPKKLTATIGAFRCSNSHITFVEQPDSADRLIYPSRCETEGCYDTRNITLDNGRSVFDDFQKVHLELLKVGEGGSSRTSVVAHLYGDLVDRLQSGGIAIVTGVLRVKSSPQKLDYILELNSIKPY